MAGERGGGGIIGRVCSLRDAYSPSRSSTIRHTYDRISVRQIIGENGASVGLARCRGDFETWIDQPNETATAKRNAKSSHNEKSIAT